MDTTCFDPQALTSLTGAYAADFGPDNRFRSTGSYEPDLYTRKCKGRGKDGFDPQALTSLTRIHFGSFLVRVGFDPQALTSLTLLAH